NQAKLAREFQIKDTEYQQKLERLQKTYNSVAEQVKNAKQLNDYSKVTAETLIPPTVSVPRSSGSAIVLTTFGLGLGLGLGLVLPADRLDPRLRSVTELRQVLRYPVLSVVPRLPKSAVAELPSVGVVTYSAPRSSLSEAYRSVRTKLAFLARDRRYQVI